MSSALGDINQTPGVAVSRFARKSLRTCQIQFCLEFTASITVCSLCCPQFHVSSFTYGSVSYLSVVALPGVTTGGGGGGGGSCNVKTSDCVSNPRASMLASI